MHSYQKFLFYYSLIVLTILLTVSLFFLPKPQNFFAIALLVPIPLYFWLRITLEGEKSPYLWSLKMLGILFITGILGIFAFWLSGKTPNKNPENNLEKTVSLPEQKEVGSDEKDDESIKKFLEEIKTDLSQINAEQRAIREALEISESNKDATDTLNTILGQTASSTPSKP